MLLTRDTFENKAALQDAVAQMLKHGRVGLFLGAGISLQLGLPDWSGLVEGLYRRARLKRPRAANDLLRQAEFIKGTVYTDSDEKFAAAVRAELYRKAKTDFTSLRNNLTMVAIATMVMSSRRGSVSEVFTLNYDNLLETYLRVHGFVVHPVWHEPTWGKVADVTVYHPHGYLPLDDAENGSERIVMTQTDYDFIVGKDGNHWRQRMLCGMRNKFTLFLGLSGDDQNLSSVFTELEACHAAKASGWPFWGLVFTTNPDPPIRRQWEKRGVYTVRVSDYGSALPNYLLEICQKAAKLI